MRATLTNDGCTYDGDTSPTAGMFTIEVENQTEFSGSFVLLSLAEGSTVDDLQPALDQYPRQFERDGTPSGAAGLQVLGPLRRRGRSDQCAACRRPRRHIRPRVLCRRRPSHRADPHRGAAGRDRVAFAVDESPKDSRLPLSHSRRRHRARRSSLCVAQRYPRRALFLSSGRHARLYQAGVGDPRRVGRLRAARRRRARRQPRRRELAPEVQGEVRACLHPLADPDHGVADEYGVWVESTTPARRTGASSAPRS